MDRNEKGIAFKVPPPPCGFDKHGISFLVGRDGGCPCRVKTCRVTPSIGRWHPKGWLGPVIFLRERCSVDMDGSSCRRKPRRRGHWSGFTLAHNICGSNVQERQNGVGQYFRCKNGPCQASSFFPTNLAYTCEFCSYSQVNPPYSLSTLRRSQLQSVAPPPQPVHSTSQPRQGSEALEDSN
uniref:Uncharacterized protein n=1 Tax=Pyricularia oryzae (strain P131) TaxID=1143193 RepID=L7IPS7_PYRO1